MALFETKHEKKAAQLTALIAAALLSLLFIFGLTYLDPPPEGGIAVNFGYQDTGSGDNNTTERVRSNPAPPPPVEEQQQQPQSQPDEQAVTQDTEEAPVVAEEKPTPKPQKPVEQKPQTKPTESKPAKPVEQKPDQQTQDLLNSAISGPASDGTTDNGDGDGTKPGNQGNPDGSLYANTYYGKPGAGQSGTGYGLSGRSAKGHQKFLQDCNEEGRVIVEITVNRAGQVTRANPGKKGTTNTAQCLLDAAKRTAESYRFNAASDAPASQIGFVEVIFKLGE